MTTSRARSAHPTALVTGASRGIGAAIADRLAAQGHALTIAARTADALRRRADELRNLGAPEVVTVPTDMSDNAQVELLAETHRDAHGRVDVVVLSAGMGAIGPFADYPIRRLDRMYAVNLRAPYLLLQHLTPLLREAGSHPRGGKVFAIASMTGISGEPLNSAYGATKAALISLCETINTEESVNGVTATAVAPGYVATTMTEGLAESVPLDSMLPVDDVADAVMGLTVLSRRTVVPQLVLARPGAHLWRA
jgi:short-subunit dehydrogenase